MKWIAIVVLSLGAGAILLYICVSFSLRGAGPSAKDSEFIDERFLLLLFPVGEDIPCRRAVIASLSEYKQEFVEVYVDGAAVAILTSDFTAVPPEDYAAWVERLNTELALWGEETDWAHTDYVFIPYEKGGKAMLTVTNKTGTKYEYTYVLNGTSVRPLQVKTKVNTAKSLSH